MTNEEFAVGIFVVIGVLFLALLYVALTTPAGPALWALTGAAGMCFVVMLLFFMATVSNRKTG